jgi:hypothetical protein
LGIGSSSSKVTRDKTTEDGEKSSHDDSSTKQQAGGRKLWIKSAGSKIVKLDKPPPGYEKHKHIEHYQVDDEEEQHRYRHKRRMEKKRSGSRPRRMRKREAFQTRSLDPTTPKRQHIHIERVYTIGMGRQSLQKFIQRLVDAEIELVIDLRSEEAMLGPGFTKGRDLAILLKEAAGIDYRRDEVLVPRRELLLQYNRDKNWKRFAEGYYDQLRRQRAENVLSREQFGKFKVALIGENISPERDQRRIAADYLKEQWGILGKVNL